MATTKACHAKSCDSPSSSYHLLSNGNHVNLIDADFPQICLSLSLSLCLSLSLSLSHSHHTHTIVTIGQGIEVMQDFLGQQYFSVLGQSCLSGSRFGDPAAGSIKTFGSAV